MILVVIYLILASKPLLTVFLIDSFPFLFKSYRQDNYAGYLFIYLFIDLFLFFSLTKLDAKIKEKDRKKYKREKKLQQLSPEVFGILTVSISATHKSIRRHMRCLCIKTRLVGRLNMCTVLRELLSKTPFPSQNYIYIYIYIYIYVKLKLQSNKKSL